MFGQNRLGLWALQRQQRAVLDQLDGNSLRFERVAQAGDVGVLARGVHDQEQVIAAVGDHQVVLDPAVVVGENRIALAAFRQADHVDRHQAFQRLGGALAAQHHLAHVADVEQPGGLARVQMFLHHAQRVLHRHVVTGERHHLRAQRAMHRLQRCVLKLVDLGHAPLRFCPGHAVRACRREIRPRVMPPLSRRLRSLSLRRPGRAGISPESSCRDGPWA